ncbi:MAG: hypothetical protein ACPGUE_14680 [Marinomonas sp.]
METIKFTAAKTETLKQAINLLDMFRCGASLKSIKEQASISGLEVVGRTFKAIYPQLVSFYEDALNTEESETLTITTEQAAFIGKKVLTDKDIIEIEVDKVGGTWVKRKNTRTKLVKSHNDKLQVKIDNLRKIVRSMISEKEQSKRDLYRKISELELKKI